MIEAVFYWTGATVWLILALVLLWIVSELIWAAVVTVSYFRFSIATIWARGDRPKWRHLPRAAWYRWREFIGFRKGSISFSGPAGYWRGIGDWKAYKRVENQ